MFKLKPKNLFKIPVYAKSISPDNFFNKSKEEILKLEVQEGNKKKSVKDLFYFQGEKVDELEKVKIFLEGELSKVRKIGWKMSSGKIHIKGNVGMHLGEKMRGGEIKVEGNVDSWVGSMMENGVIEVVGSAGDYVGAPNRGSVKGMKNGVIMIKGNAGSDVGCYLRGGLIEISGNVKDFVGSYMNNGNILIRGDCEDRVGAGMMGGKIVIFGYIPSVLPTFTIDSIRPSIKIKGVRIEESFYNFIGDLANKGEGKLLVTKSRNQHLSFYEKFL